MLVRLHSPNFANFHPHNLVRNLINLKSVTYLLTRRNLKQTLKAPLTFASLCHELLCLHACRVVIVRRVQQGIAQARGEVIA